MNKNYLLLVIFGILTCNSQAMNNPHGNAQQQDRRLLNRSNFSYIVQQLLQHQAGQEFNRMNPDHPAQLRRNQEQNRQYPIQAVVGILDQQPQQQVLNIVPEQQPAQQQGGTAPQQPQSADRGILASLPRLHIDTFKRTRNIRTITTRRVINPATRQVITQVQTMVTQGIPQTVVGIRPEGTPAPNFISRRRTNTSSRRVAVFTQHQNNNQNNNQNT